MSKFDIFYPFDRGFFGKTLGTSVKNGLRVVCEKSKGKLDSVDDLNHYFAQKMKSNLERMPVEECFIRSADIKPSSNRTCFDVFFCDL